MSTLLALYTVRVDYERRAGTVLERTVKVLAATDAQALREARDHQAKRSGVLRVVYCNILNSQPIGQLKN